MLLTAYHWLMSPSSTGDIPPVYLTTLAFIIVLCGIVQWMEARS